MMFFLYEPKQHEEHPAEPSTLELLQTKDLLYAWVDKLNIRDTPKLEGKTIASVDNQEALEFTGEKSRQSETIVLRGVAYDEPSLKVITSDQKEGWVFGGAVKRKGEDKGNGLMTETDFDLPYFGRFDLKDWTRQPSKAGADEGDPVLVGLVGEVHAGGAADQA